MRDSRDSPETVGDLMTVDLIAVRPDDRVGRARDLLLTLSLHALPVLDGSEVHGIVTSTDLVEEWTDDEQIWKVMTPAPTLINVAATLQEAAETMIKHRIHHLLVTDETEVIGILSSFDLLEALAESVPYRR